MQATRVTYTISMRGKPEPTPVLGYLQTYFDQVSLRNIDSVFGFVERSPLYGGRPFLVPELSEGDVRALYVNDIGLRLPLSNHAVSREEYLEARPFLDKYHREGNTVIVTNDDLAKWIREDYRLFRIEASAIKNIDNHKKITETLKIYDTVVLPAKLNDDAGFLRQIGQKERIRLFLNAGCAYNCPSKMCYPTISEMNKYTGAVFRCSHDLIPREVKMHNFDEQALVAMGFTKFKILRAGPKTGF